MSDDGEYPWCVRCGASCATIVETSISTYDDADNGPYWVCSGGCRPKDLPQLAKRLAWLAEDIRRTCQETLGPRAEAHLRFRVSNLEGLAEMVAEMERQSAT